MSPISSEEIRLRFPPSPTGLLTLGGVRTALSNWLFARQKGGQFILRIEDTDPERSKKEYESVITESLKWLGLTWDEGPDWEMNNSEWEGSSKGEFGPYRQSERGDIYKKYLQQLLDEKKAYYCYCTKEELEAQSQTLELQGLPVRYTGYCRTITTPPAGRDNPIIRLKVPPAIVEFQDIIRGKLRFDAALLGDIVIARSLDSALYHFAVVVDDELMNISHIIRGEDHISNTPKHILLQIALGFRQPVYGHLPVVLGSDGKKLSKRTAEVSLMDYRDKGYLPEAIINFLALLGWHPKDDQEIFTLEELTEKFDIKRVQKAGAHFDTEKLDWINAQHIKRLSDEELIQRLQPFLAKTGVTISEELLKRIVTTQRGRLKLLGEFVPQNDFFLEVSEYDANLLVWKDDSKEKTLQILPQTIEIMQTLSGEEYIKNGIMQQLQPLLEKEGRGSVLWPMRVALSGKSASPDPTEIAEVIGKEETVKRLQYALDKLSRVIV